MVVVGIIRSLRSLVALSIEGLSNLFETPTHQSASRYATEHLVVRQLAQEIDALARGSGSLQGCEGGVAQVYRLVGLQGQSAEGRQNSSDLSELAEREGSLQSKIQAGTARQELTKCTCDSDAVIRGQRSVAQVLQYVHADLRGLARVPQQLQKEEHHPTVADPLDIHQYVQLRSGRSHGPTCAERLDQLLYFVHTHRRRLMTRTRI